LAYPSSCTPTHVAEAGKRVITVDPQVSPLLRRKTRAMARQEHLLRAWRRAVVEWERQHKYLTWYVAFVSTAIFLLLIAERF
jgi:hypothetical protein